MEKPIYSFFSDVLIRQTPDAGAILLGSPDYPQLQGAAYFYGLPYGTLVTVSVDGLPFAAENRAADSGSASSRCHPSFFGLHIHEGGRCTGTREEPFRDAGSHFNPDDCAHPSHAGDLPPLLGNHGFAWSSFFTERFHVPDIIGRTVIIHAGADDFKTQPSGDSGPMIACGPITTL